MALYRAESATYGYWSSSEKCESGEAINACVICLETMKVDLATLSCGHVFHHNCLIQALARHEACPVCRRKAAPRNAVRLYLSISARTRFDNDGTIRSSHSAQPVTTASDLREHLQEMKAELDEALQIQRMTSSHSFRLQNELVRRRQQLEQAMWQMQQTQDDFDSTKKELKRWQRIATTNYAQSNEAKQMKADYELKVRTTAERMLEKIRERRHTRCPSCASHWAEMQQIALEFASEDGQAPSGFCCPRHAQSTAAWSTLSLHHRHDQVCYDV